jgi:hypothetical protein
MYITFSETVSVTIYNPKDRYRSLVILLKTNTGYWSLEKWLVPVSPVDGEYIFLDRTGQDSIHSPWLVPVTRERGPIPANIECFDAPGGTFHIPQLLL